MSTHATSLDVAGVRAGFPSLREGRIYLDNPGGTQVHGSVMTAVTEYYLQSNANLGGPFETSVASDAVLEGARDDLARFLGCGRRRGDLRRQHDDADASTPRGR